MLKEVQVIESLKKHVGKFGIGDALFGRLDARTHRIALYHLVDGKVLPDIAQKFHESLRAQPVGVVDHNKRRPEKFFKLPPQSLGIAADGLVGEKVALFAFASRVADHARGAADENDDPMPRLDKAPQNNYAHELAYVKGVGRRIDPPVERARGIDYFLERPGVLEDVAALAEHSRKLHRRRLRLRVTAPKHVYAQL